MEQSAVLLGLCTHPEIFYGRDFIWFEDNSVVLSGLAKGASGEEDLDAGVACTHLLLAQLRWWEYVESDSNWSDGASRLLDQDVWLRQQGFLLEWGLVPDWAYTCSASERLVHVKAVTDAVVLQNQ